MQQFSVVRIMSLKREFKHCENSFGSRAPRVGDIATIIDLYDEAFDLECCDENGITLWLELFEAKDAQLDLVCI